MTPVASTSDGNGAARRFQVDHLAGGLAGGFVSTLVVHPLDLLKIRFAVNEGTAEAGRLRPQYASYWAAARSVVRVHGLRGLYQGASPNLVGATAAWGLYFQCYNMLKSHMRTHAEEDLSPSQHMFAGILSGFATLAVTNPIWVVKTRLCLQYETKARHYHGMLDALRKIFAAEGIYGLYKGFVPGLIGTSHGAIQFVVYDELKYRYCRHKNIPTKTKLRWSTKFQDSGWYLTFAAISKSFAASVTYPYQLVRARLQDQHVQYGGVIDCARRTFRHEGIRGFYKGLLASLLRVTPATCVTFVVYEHVKHAVQNVIIDTQNVTPTPTAVATAYCDKSFR